MVAGVQTLELSVCVVTYNSRENLLRLLDSLANARLTVAYEIIIRDNASTDGLAQALLEEKPRVAYHRNERNLFYTAACNQALSLARGKYVLIINPDIAVEPDAIQVMMDYLPNHADVGAVGPRFYRQGGEWRTAMGRFLTQRWGLLEASGLNEVWPGNSENRRVFPDGEWYDVDSIQEAEVLYGACIMTRRCVLQEVGLLDEQLVHGWDEYDWCLRVRTAGWKLRYLPAAKVMHVEGASRRVLNKESVLYQHHWAGLLHLYEKHHCR
jgi:hypothetical protein